MSKKLTSAGLFKALELAWDESKHKRGSKGTKQGGKFVSKEDAEESGEKSPDNESSEGKPSIGTARGLGANADNAKPGTKAFLAKHAKAADYYDKLVKAVESGEVKPSLNIFHRKGADGKTEVVHETAKDVAKGFKDDAGYHRSMLHSGRKQYETEGVKAYAASSYANIKENTPEAHAIAHDLHNAAAQSAREIGDRREMRRHEAQAEEHGKKSAGVVFPSGGATYKHGTRDMPKGGDKHPRMLSLVEHDDEFEDTLILSMSIADHLDVRDTKDPLTFWKEVAREGDFKKGEQDVKLRKRHFDHWANSFLEMSQIGVKVPVPLEHTKDPERKRGDVLKLVSRPNKEGVNALYAKIKFRDAEAAKLKDSGCSIFVPKEVPTGTGKVFKSAIEHICVTDYPVIPGLEPFTQAIALAFDGHQHTSQQEQEPTVANPIIEKLRTNYKQRTGVELGLTDEIAMSHLVLDSAVRIGDLDAMDVLSLEFPPKPGAAPAPGAPPAGPPAAKPAGPPAPAAVTVRSVADALGVDPSITDEGQLLTMVLQQVTQMKARAMAAPPAAPPGMPAAPPLMPRPMAPARPPMAMSLSDLLPQEVILSLSKKQVRKLEHRLNELHVDAAIEQAELALELDERVEEPSLKLSLDDLIPDDEPELELAMPANLLETLKHARSATVDSLFKRGIVTGAGRKMLMDRFVDGQAVALSHRHDDGFNAQVTLLEANGPVLKTKSGTGPQAVDAQVLELSNGQHGGVNPLHADADRRARGEPNH